MVASTFGLVSLAGASTRPAGTSIKGVSVYGAASPEALEAGSAKTSSFTVTVTKNGKPDAGVAVTINVADIINENDHFHVCSTAFVAFLESRSGGTGPEHKTAVVGKTNKKGQLTFFKYLAAGVLPGSFCVVYGGILGATGISTLPKDRGLGASATAPGEDFYFVICQGNPADDVYSISQSAAATGVHTAGPNDKFTMTVKDESGAPVNADDTMFVTEVHSVYQSCGNPGPVSVLPAPSPTAYTGTNGLSVINYKPSTTVGTCKVTAQEADTMQMSNTVKITQSTP